jgi:hypothetical protein
MNKAAGTINNFFINDFFDKKYYAKILQQTCNAIVNDDLLLKAKKSSNSCRL